MNDLDRIKQLLRQALPPVDPDAESPRDLWPAVLRRLDSAAETPRALPVKIPLLDWALLAGLVIFVLSFPAMIPVFLYYL
jgi:hypothetical protein